jgi:hypothetical protein
VFFVPTEVMMLRELGRSRWCRKDSEGTPQSCCFGNDSAGNLGSCMTPFEMVNRATTSSTLLSVLLEHRKYGRDSFILLTIHFYQLSG